jgi:hypothetical protein
MQSTSVREYRAESCHSGEVLDLCLNSDVMRPTAASIPEAAANILVSNGVARPHLKEDSARMKSRPLLSPLHIEYAEAPLLLPDAVVWTPPSAYIVVQEGHSRTASDSLRYPFVYILGQYLLSIYCLSTSTIPNNISTSINLHRY